MKIKPLFKIHWHTRLWFSYYSTTTLRRQGEWDLYAITKKSLSQMPRQFRIILKQQLKEQKEKHGRTLKTIREAVFNAGRICGFECKKKGELVLWSVRDKSGDRMTVFAIAGLHSRWRKDSRCMTRQLRRSKGFLRFVVDNNNRNTLWSIPKRKLG